MTRKRYVKLLMALGMDRNEANATAYLCRKTGKTYEASYKASAPWIRVRMAARRAGKAIKKMGISIVRDTAALAAKLNYNMHHAGHPVTVQIVTREEHAAIHRHDGYRPAITLVDEWDSLPSDKLHDRAMSACAGGGRDE